VTRTLGGSKEGKRVIVEKSPSQLGFAGDIDEVRIFNRALSAGEIHNVFAGGQ